MQTAPPPDVDRVLSGGRTRRRRRNVLVAGFGVLAGVVVLAGAYGVLQVGDGGSNSEAPITTQPSDPAAPEAFPSGEEGVPVEAGTYLVPSNSRSLTGYTVTVPDGWMVQGGTDLKKHEDSPQGIGISPWALDDIGVFEDACHGEEGFPAPPPDNVASLVSGLRAQKSGPLVSDPVATTVGGLPSTRVDLGYPDRMASADCRVGTGLLQVWDGYFVFFPHYTASVYVVAGTSQVFLVEMADGASAADRSEVQSILDSISFEPVE